MSPFSLLLLLINSALFAQFYPFAIDQDSLSGPVDFSALNHPLGPADRLFVKQGRFHRVGDDQEPDTADDAPVRLFGVNLAFSANFPSFEDAPRIAKRLRRLGVNLVRLHHMDTQPDRVEENAASLLTTGPYPTLNPRSVERLRAFLDALKAEGIYVNLNLHVGYEFRPAVDGVPLGEPRIPTQSKPFHIFYPRMIELQQEFTRQVIASLKLAGDPVLAMVEINNESSLLWEWQTANLDAKLGGEYKTELERQWNAYLRTRYASRQDLEKAWGPSTADGADLLSGPWRLELHAGSRATMVPREDGGEPLLEVRVEQGPAPVIVKRVGFSLSAGKAYVAEVEMRAELPPGASRNVYWDVKQDIAPWRTVTGRTVAVTNQWQRFTLAVQPVFDLDGIGRFGLSVERVDAPLFIRRWSLRELGWRGLDPEESLAGGNVRLPLLSERSTERRRLDYVDFLVETDRAYLNRMRETIHALTGPLTPVAGTQIGFGGLMTLDSHRDLDYHDNHFYIDHYNFPNVAWDGRDWRIRDSSAVGSGLTTILNIAAARPAGKPYTVSEYNQNWPNSQGAEIDPLVAAIGAFQDWDALVHFAYSHGRNWDAGVPNGFNLNGDWTKFANFGQSAWLFRTGAIQPAKQRIDIPAHGELRLRATIERRNNAIAAFLTSALGYAPETALCHAVQLQEGDFELDAEARRRPEGVLRADTGEFSYDPQARLFVLEAPLVAGVIGFAGSRVIQAGPVSLQLEPSARGWVVLLLTPRDGRPLGESRRLLLSLPGQTLRTQPGTHPPQPQRLVNYPSTSDWWTLEPDPFSSKPSGDLNAGLQPTFMERIECRLRLQTTASRLRVYPLDGSGRRRPALAAQFVESVEGGFRIHLQAEGQEFSPWYELELD